MAGSGCCRDPAPASRNALPRAGFANAAKSSSGSAAGPATRRLRTLPALGSRTPGAPSPFPRRDPRRARRPRGPSPSSFARRGLALGWRAARVPARGQAGLRGPSRAPWGLAAAAPAPWLPRWAPRPRGGSGCRATRLRHRTWRRAQVPRLWKMKPWSWANRIPETEREGRGRGPHSSQWDCCPQAHARRAAPLLNGPRASPGAGVRDPGLRPEVGVRGPGPRVFLSLSVLRCAASRKGTPVFMRRHGVRLDASPRPQKATPQVGAELVPGLGSPRPPL